MGDIELRWLVSKGIDGPERQLQYRVKITLTDYSAHGLHGDFQKTRQWSEWINVPVIYGDMDI